MTTWCLSQKCSAFPDPRGSPLVASNLSQLSCGGMSQCWPLCQRDPPFPIFATLSSRDHLWSHLYRQSRQLRISFQINQWSLATQVWDLSERTAKTATRRAYASISSGVASSSLTLSSCDGTTTLLGPEITSNEYLHPHVTQAVKPLGLKLLQLGQAILSSAVMRFHSHASL